MSSARNNDQYRYHITAQNRDNSLQIYDGLRQLELHVIAQSLAQYQAFIHEFSPRDALILGYLLRETASDKDAAHQNQQAC